MAVPSLKGGIQTDEVHVKNITDMLNLSVFSHKIKEKNEHCLKNTNHWALSDQEKNSVLSPSYWTSWEQAFKLK